MDVGNWNMSTNPVYRLCCHMIETSGGATGSLDISMNWEKVIYPAM